MNQNPAELNQFKNKGNKKDFSVIPYNDSTRLLSQIASNHYEKNQRKRVEKQEEQIKAGLAVSEQLKLPIFETKTFNLKDVIVKIEPKADIKQFDNKRFQTHLVLGKLYEENKNRLRFDKLPVVLSDGTTTEGKEKLYLILTIDELREAYGYTGTSREAKRKDKEVIKEQIDYFANLKINYKYTKQYTGGKGKNKNSIIQFIETPKGKERLKTLDYSYTFLDGYCKIVNNNYFYIPLTQEYLSFLKAIETGSRFFPTFLLKNQYVTVNTLGHFLINHKYKYSKEEAFTFKSKSFTVSIDSIYKYTNLPSVEAIKNGLFSGNYYMGIIIPFIKQIELLQQGGVENNLFNLYISDKEGNPIDKNTITKDNLFNLYLYFEWLICVDEPIIENIKEP